MKAMIRQQRCYHERVSQMRTTMCEFIFRTLALR